VWYRIYKLEQNNCSEIDLKVYVNQHDFVLDTVADTRGGGGGGGGR
jgi:hypothetical protein